MPKPAKLVKLVKRVKLVKLVQLVKLGSMQGWCSDTAAKRCEVMQSISAICSVWQRTTETDRKTGT